MQTSTENEPLDAALSVSLAAPKAITPWSDFHLVLVISREGSVAKACHVLDMTHSTLLRKLDTIETRLKTRLFDRGRSTYTLTTAGQLIAQAARDFEPLASEAEANALGQDLRPTGQVRVSLASVVLHQLLPPLLVQFSETFPNVQLALNATREHVSLRRREADVAIRIADTVPDWLVGRKMADVRFRVYGLGDGTALPKLSTVRQLAKERRWIGFDQDASDLKFDRWLAETVPDSSVVLRVDDFNNALALVRSGLGIALLPTFVERGSPDLVPLTAVINELTTPLWMLTHPDLKRAMRVQIMMRSFGPALAGMLKPDECPPGPQGTWR
jgi:DNA-binding transcriptional LysR family regulator